MRLINNKIPKLMLYIVISRAVELPSQIGKIIELVSNAESYEIVRRIFGDAASNTMYSIIVVSIILLVLDFVLIGFTVVKVKKPINKIVIVSIVSSVLLLIRAYVLPQLLMYFVERPTLYNLSLVNLPITVIINIVWITYFLSSKKAKEYFEVDNKIEEDFVSSLIEEESR